MSYSAQRWQDGKERRQVEGSVRGGKESQGHRGQEQMRSRGKGGKCVGGKGERSKADAHIEEHKFSDIQQNNATKPKDKKLMENNIFDIFYNVLYCIYG